MKDLTRSKRCWSLIAAFIITFQFSFVNAIDRYVNPDGLCGGNLPCYTTIQAAINASNAGDVIHVASGTYHEDIDINKTLTVTGAGYTTTLISGPIGGGGATVRISAPGVVFGAAGVIGWRA